MKIKLVLYENPKLIDLSTDSVDEHNRGAGLDLFWQKKTYIVVLLNAHMIDLSTNAVNANNRSARLGAWFLTVFLKHCLYLNLKILISHLPTDSVDADNRSARLGARVVCVGRTRDCYPVS